MKRLALTLMLAGSLAVTSCAAGQNTETESQVAAVNGASADGPTVAIRDAQFSFPLQGSHYPAGSALPVQTVLINTGVENDRLVQVTSPFSEPAQLAGQTQLPSRTSLHAFGKPQNPNLPGAKPVAGQRAVEITLPGLKREITPGVTIPVTFVFEKGGAVTAQVPIGADLRPRPEQPSHGGGH